MLIVVKLKDFLKFILHRWINCKQCLFVNHCK